MYDPQRDCTAQLRPSQRIRCSKMLRAFFIRVGLSHNGYPSRVSPLDTPTLCPKHCVHRHPTVITTIPDPTASLTWALLIQYHQSHAAPDCRRRYAASHNVILSLYIYDYSNTHPYIISPIPQACLVLPLTCSCLHRPLHSALQSLQDHCSTNRRHF